MTDSEFDRIIAANGLADTITFDWCRREYLAEYAAGYDLATDWFAAGAPKREAEKLAAHHTALRHGGITGCDTVMVDADDFPSFLAHVAGTQADREIFDGVAEMAAINTRQGTNYAPWPRRCFAISFDDARMLGFLQAVHHVVNL